MSDDSSLILDPDEPQTPAWFSFLGLGLFLLAGIFFLVGTSEEGDGVAQRSGQNDSSAAPDDAAPDDAAQD